MNALSKTFRSLLPIVVAAPFSLLPCLAQDADGKKAIDPKAKAIMDAVVARYSGATSISGDATMTIKQTLPEAFGGGTQDIVVTHTITRQGGNFAQTTKGDAEMVMNFYVDGDEVTLALDDSTAVQAKVEGGPNAAIRSESFGFQKEADSNMILDQHLPATLMRSLVLNDKEHPWDKGVIGMALEGDEEIDGVPADKLTLTMRQNAGFAEPIVLKTEVWISKGDAPALLKFAPDMSAVVDQMLEDDPTFEGMKIEMTGRYTKPVIGEELATDAFTPQLTEPVEKFPSFKALIEGMVRPQEEEGGGQDPTQLVGTDAPDFELDLLAGGTFKLSEKKDTVVILDFWATWCGPCVQALPVLMKVSGAFADKGVQLIGVNQQEEKGAVEAFLKKKKWDLTVALDKEGKAAQLYLVRGIPQTVIVGKDGKVRKVHVGFSPGLEEKLTEELKEILAE